MQNKDNLRSISMNNPPILSHKHTSSTVSAPPEHLSEFYSFMNNQSNISISPNQSPKVQDFSVSNKKITRQPSLNTFTSFTPSVLDLPNILSSNDFENSINSYENMISKSENFRKALLQVSQAANEFGQALEDTINLNPKVNNNKQVTDGLINAGSLQYIVGSNNQILSKLLLENFQNPLSKELEILKDNYKSNYNYYQQEVKLKSKLLRAKELENIKLSKSKTRNLSVYKNNLMNLTNQLDEIDRLKYDYYHEVNLMMENFNQNQLLIRTGSMIRAELELFEGIARKGWSGGGLDQLLSISPDLFTSNDLNEIHQLNNDNNNTHGMESINEDNESFVSDLQNQRHEEYNPSETLETVKLNNHLRSGSNIESIDISTPKISQSQLHEGTYRSEDELEEDDKGNDSKETGVTGDGEYGGGKEEIRAPQLEEPHDMDESFSLPRINGNSLVNSQGKSEGKFNSDNILNDLES